jgi:hypothetical protein
LTLVCGGCATGAGDGLGCPKQGTAEADSSTEYTHDDHGRVYPVPRDREKPCGS